MEYKLMDETLIKLMRLANKYRLSPVRFLLALLDYVANAPPEHQQQIEVELERAAARQAKSD